MAVLRISDHLSLPIDAVTQTFAILGIRGSGKTNSAVDLAEEMLAAQQQVVILDPVDVWFGLRSSADGKSSGYRITILGGEHADLPLEASAGAILADFVVDHLASVVISLRHLSMGDQRRFAADFATRLYERKGETKSRSPLHLIVDESDEFVPQRIPPGGERMFGAFDRIVRRGRAAGIGVTLISQRPQVVNKDVLSQIETLICHRVLHKLDRKALEAWIEAHDVDSQGEAFMASLASLERGDAWVWSPEWLGIFSRVHMRARKTFDSSATPKAGEKRAEPRQLATVDLDELRKRMAATIERAKADDPKELRREIAERDKRIRELERQPKTAAAPVIDVTAEVQRAVAAAVTKQHDFYVSKLTAFTSGVNKLVGELSVNGFVPPPITLKAAAAPGQQYVTRPAPPFVRREVAPRSTTPGERLPEGERAILVATAQLGDASREHLSLLTGYKRSTRDAYLQRLIGKGFVEVTGAGVAATDAGVAALGSDYEPLPTGDALREYWLRRLPEGEAKLLALIAERYPRGAGRDELSAASEYQRSTRDAYLQRLAARKLIRVIGRGEVCASEHLF